VIASHPLSTVAPVWMASILLGAVGAPSCAGCGVGAGPLCPSCAGKIRAPLARGEPPGIDRILAAWEYDGAARELVLALKLRTVRPAAIPLAAAMAALALRNGLRGTELTWVPARRRDVRRRGYDHAEILAREVGRRLGLPARARLHRVADRPDQAALGARERRRNLRGVFAGRACPGGVVLVDDLVTTGATAAACTAALRAAGASRIEVLVACRKS
jgi:predicted amidophosphoribosyltransferase